MNMLMAYYFLLLVNVVSVKNTVLEKFKESVDKGNGASLTDISKAFDCIYRKFLIAKLFWYGGSTLSFNPIFI